MSKELIERAKNPTSCDVNISLIDDLVDLIEELERERDALQADNVELVAALKSAREMIGHPDNIAIIDEALAKVRKP